MLFQYKMLKIKPECETKNYINVHFNQATELQEMFYWLACLFLILICNN